jgi:gluconokinase
VSRIVIVTGVSGSGKSTVAGRLADRLGWDYADADDFHPPANIEKMSAGIPLTDTDRRPWLRAISDWIGERLDSGEPGVVTCSALKRAYRDALAGGRPGARLVFLDGDRDLIARRMGERTGHFFRPELLDSQFRDLERPAPDEDVLSVPITVTPDETVSRIIRDLALEPPVWKAPEVERHDEPKTGDERAMLQGLLDHHRRTLLRKCTGLTAEQMAEASVPPSNLTLLGLVRHMTEVERSWFRDRFAGEPVDFPYYRDDRPDADFEDLDPARAAEEYARLPAEWELSDAAVADASLDDTFTCHGTERTLRWLYLHMIEEYARHNGHADLLRERIDGSTGS